MAALLNAFGIKGSLLLAQAVNFGIVLLALWYFLYKPIAKILAERQTLVAKGVDDAKEAGEKLAHADRVAASRVEDAEKEAQQVVASARAAAGAEQARILKEAEARAAQVAADGEARATEATARAKRDSDKDIARLAILAAEKVMQKNYD